MSGLTVDLEDIEQYYKMKKKEVSNWLMEYIMQLKRINKYQKEQLIAYAKDIKFNSIDDFYSYAQELPTISKKDKQRLMKYLQNIDWLPKDMPFGFLDGCFVSRALPETQADKMIQAAFGPIKGINDND